MDLSASENAEIDESCDSSSDVTKLDFPDGINYDSHPESGSESQIDFGEPEARMRNSASSGLTMKEYEEQLKKLTAENFNLKLRVYFVEERLSKVSEISDKEDLIQKNIQLKVTCESQLKELEKKQELLFEASKAFELLQKEHAEEIEKLMKEKCKEISGLEEKCSKLETTLNELKIKYPETCLNSEKERYLELEHMLKDNQLELESYELKSQRMESELEQRMHKIEELVDELEQKEHDLASANYRIRKLEDDLKTRLRDDDINKERLEEKNRTIESLKNSLASRYETIETLENKISKEKSVNQSMQSKFDSLNFQNSRLKEELEILQSRLRRTTEALSPRSKMRQSDDEQLKQKYEELQKTMEEKEMEYGERMKSLEEKIQQNNLELEEYQEVLEKQKKLEDDHRKACVALKNFMKRSSDEKKEREALNQMLNSREEMIAELKAELNQYRKQTMPPTLQDDKLSLPDNGDNDNKSNCIILYESENNNESENNIVEENAMIKSKGTNDVDHRCVVCGIDKKVEKVLELEAEMVVLKQQMEEKITVDSETKENIKKKLEEKKLQIDMLNGEIKNKNLPGFVRKEIIENNYKIEEVEKRLIEFNEMKDAVVMLQHELRQKDDQLNILQSKLQEMGHATPDSPGLLDCKLFLGVSKTESLISGISEGVKEISIWSMNNEEETYGNSNENQIGDYKAGHSNRDKSSKFKKNTNNSENETTAKICYMLSLRLEELATFLDSLLKNGELLTEVGYKKFSDLKEAMEKSRDLSKHLSQSFVKTKKKDDGTTTGVESSFCDLSSLCCDSLTQLDCSSNIMAKDKVISEQTIIINRLREQLKLLNQEIRQRDIELSHCQRIEEKEFDNDNLDASDQDQIEKQTLSICQDISDDLNDQSDQDSEKKDESFEKPIKKLSFLANENENFFRDNRETSESEAWSEPDRSVSLARMGRLDDAGLLSLSQKNSKCDYSSDSSSEETLNENLRSSGKRSKNSETEIRRLQSKVKSLDEINSHLRLQINVLKNDQKNLEFISKIQKLKKTMDRLEECSLTCRQMEEQLSAALERASVSAVQLAKATENITILEEQINMLKEELGAKNAELEEKKSEIIKLENKIEEITIESELKLIEAGKQREAAERKTFEVECKLKDVENMSKDVESKVNDLEKRLCGADKMKKETTIHFKEAEMHVDTAEKMMEEAEKIKNEAERKSKDFQNFIDLMRKEVEEKMKEAERRIKKSEREKEEIEKQVFKLKKKLMEAEKNKVEVEAKVDEGKQTIHCMEEKLKELEVAMDQCNEDAQKKIKEIQKKADSKILELEMKMEEKEWTRKMELEKKIIEAEKIGREIETGFRRQLEDAEKKITRAKESADKQETLLKQKIIELEGEKKKETSELLRQIDEIKLEASEFELELTKLTNEKIQLEEELKKMMDRETNLVKDNKEIKGKYENSIHLLENKLTQLSLNKSQLASRLEDIESTNIDLVTRISAIRGKETITMEHEFTSKSPTFSPTRQGSSLSNYFPNFEFFVPSESDENKPYFRQGSTASDPGNHSLGILSFESFAAPPRRNMNSSPDLGIESDPGRFSSLETNQIPIGERPGNFAENFEPVEMKKLENENAELRRRLLRTRQALEETLTQLSAANQRKKQVERAICKQLHKTHHILKKARVNFESQEGDSIE
ncbi:conserved hypothetical protein [Pediculus humanus corporis]|uniref:Centrosomin N-terminal motif 1 domain-containing protein n=1 Tax=Pediculus humanus subsp. corporis TaxID=121224 RepID=E0VJP0_PEDHC|nr:uncharacterized protein Phum_PHUM248490 [Pediculus humanus corporis]EEB13596.1 conserved hypothetical protein [Pediculus humanus corporis]